MEVTLGSGFIGNANVVSLKACKEFSERIVVRRGKGFRERYKSVNQRGDLLRLLMPVNADVNHFPLKLIVLAFTLEAIGSPSFGNGYFWWAQ